MTEEKSYAQMRREFQDKFQNELCPYLRKFEEQRKDLRFKNRLLYTLGIILIIILFPKLAQIAIFIGIIPIGIAVNKAKKFETEIKRKVMPTICACFGNIKWKPSEEYATTAKRQRQTEVYNDYMNIYDTFLLPHFDRVSYDDTFSGAYKDVNFQIVESYYTRGSGKHQVKIFGGIIIKIDMNKPFTGRTVVRTKTLFKQATQRGLKHTVLEDVQFQKQYDVFTDDEVEARYLLTPAFINRMNNVKTAFKGKVICAFYKYSLYIGIYYGGDAFSLCDLNRPMDDAYQYYQLYDEISSIYKMIDHFKLDQKIGM